MRFTQAVTVNTAINNNSLLLLILKVIRDNICKLIKAANAHESTI